MYIYASIYDFEEVSQIYTIHPDGLECKLVIVVIVYWQFMILSICRLANIIRLIYIEILFFFCKKKTIGFSMLNLYPFIAICSFLNFFIDWSLCNRFSCRFFTVLYVFVFDNNTDTSFPTIAAMTHAWLVVSDRAEFQASA